MRENSLPAFFHSEYVQAKMLTRLLCMTVASYSMLMTNSAYETLLQCCAIVFSVLIWLNRLKLSLTIKISLRARIRTQIFWRTFWVFLISKTPLATWSIRRRHPRSIYIFLNWDQLNCIFKIAQAGGTPGIFWCLFFISLNSSALDHYFCPFEMHSLW